MATSNATAGVISYQEYADSLFVLDVYFYLTATGMSPSVQTPLKDYPNPSPYPNPRKTLTTAYIPQPLSCASTLVSRPYSSTPLPPVPETPTLPTDCAG